jgi:hypothetical protein
MSDMPSGFSICATSNVLPAYNFAFRSYVNSHYSLAIISGLS